MDYQEQYSFYQELAEKALTELFPLYDDKWPEGKPPARLAEAMRYSLLNGGKRLRPVLLLAAYHSYGESLSEALPFAAAVELIHTYSLVHDDLPAMDDDDFRRGKPSSHKAFGEAMAILAGDALLTSAFEIMAESRHPHALDAIAAIAASAGARGMIAGQTADIMMSGETADVEMVRYIHRHKTADLLTAPIIAGLLLAGAGGRAIQAAENYGEALGLAFQITDDLLDLQGDPEKTGKAGGRDLELGKLTWPSLVGLGQAKKDAHAEVQKAVAASEFLGRNAGFFSQLALSIPERVK